MDKNLLIAMKILGEIPEMIESFIQILKDQGFINIPFKCDREYKVWLTLAEWDGWCLQQNGFTKHCRILDPEDIRRAWGTKTAMNNALNQIQKVYGERKNVECKK